jgi:steroid 5-alpha reductase family enzyme
MSTLSFLASPIPELITRASVLVMVWSARLAGFLLFRVLKTGSDTRFDEMRSHFFRFAGFWAGQILWVWVVCESLLLISRIR